MNEFELQERQRTPYAERKLSEQLSFACDQLYPTEGFRVELDGIQPSLLELKQLEAHTSFALDTKKGAKIKLTYDPAEEQLVLESLSHPLAGQSSAAIVVHRTENEREGLRYIQYLDAGDDKGRIADAWTIPFVADNIADLLAGYGIDSIPHPNHESYTTWRYNLLSQCQSGWKISEFASVLSDFSNNSTTTTEISRLTEYTTNDGPTTIRTISRNLHTFDTDGLPVQELGVSGVQIEGPHTASFRLRRDYVLFDANPFVGNYRPEITRSSERIPLDTDTFHDFSRIIEDTTHQLRVDQGK